MHKGSVTRLKHIIKVFVYYGFGFIIDSKLSKNNKSPANLRKAFEELGPTFVKIGQVLSTRPDILPEAYIKELSKLQDNAPKENFNTIEQLFYNEFHKTIDDSFLYFNKEPLGCASIAQVHDAILNDGRFVIVKVQRPKIEEQLNLDLSIIKKIVTLTKAKFEDSLMNPKECIDEIIYATRQELNFENEALNLKRFKALNKDVDYVYVPYIVKDFCTKKIITMENISGYKITDLKNIKKSGYSLDAMGKKLAESFFKQIFTDGFFHADPHPGNLIIHNNKICYIDFGMMGTLAPSLKQSLNEALTAVAFKDINKIVSIIMSIGIKTGYVNKNSLYEDVDYFISSYLSASLKNIRISILFQEITDISKKNNLQMPKEFTILVRSLVILEGVISKISPDLVLLDIMIPYIKEESINSFFKNIDIKELLFNSYKFTEASSKIPSKFIELSDTITSGRTKIKLEHSNFEKPLESLNRMVNRIVFAVIISSMIVGSCLILRVNIGPKVFDISIIGLIGFFIAAIMGLYLLISILRSGTL